VEGVGCPRVLRKNQLREQRNTKLFAEGFTWGSWQAHATRQQMSTRVDRAQQRSLEPYLSPDTFLDRIDKVVVEPQLGHGGTLETWGQITASRL